MPSKQTSTASAAPGASHGATVVGGGVGGALGVVAVFILNRTLEAPLSGEEASILTAALGTIFAYLMRFAPKPNGG